MNAMTQDIDQLLQKTKGALFMQQGAGFLGPLLAQLSFEWTTEIPTAAINESTLYWNPKFFLELDAKTRITVLAHELWHNAYLHGARRNGRNPKIWNYAADHVINNKLKAHGYYMDGFPYLMDPKYADEKIWSTEEIYDDLMKSAVELPSNTLEGDVLPMDQKAQEKAVRTVVEAATIARITDKAGDIPGEVILTIDEFLNPKLPWETLLQNWFNALCDYEYSYKTPSRRYEDPLLPGLSGRNGLEHLIYGQDISGSIKDHDIKVFNSELKYVQEEINPERMTVATFDTKVRDVWEYEHDQSYDSIQVTGRGGTDLVDLFRFAAERDPTALIVFTDLYVTIPPDPGFPVLWVCNDKRNDKVPYGTLIHIN